MNATNYTAGMMSEGASPEGSGVGLRNIGGRRACPFTRTRVWRRALRSATACMALAAISTHDAQAQRTPKSPAWVHESWSIADGLPVNTVNALLQSRSGYIWAATFDGLVRFDGVKFTVFNSANTPGLPSDRIVAITETHDGALWLITEQRQLIRFSRGRFTHFDRTHGIEGQVILVREDSSGTLWIGSLEEM